ncbi:hypothetical protein Afil01_42420 [Actinorhabdospora filicis]|uniref:FAR-17a/AIG1-like protein n=1 Tax=Actinorhabdospora filicis TaxID=1785913 RepID=A0A9W6SM30_9ACTN|nr:hypothetical protein [Actinorhabdospora filicis]GLZ79435.1 hypothetical protein Afil01_42420 [Actinorhabdospora filicis]
MEAQAQVTRALWRLAVAFMALFGVWNTIYYSFAGESFIDWEGLRELSQSGSALAGVVYIGLALTLDRPERVSSWLRGAMAVLMLLIAVTSMTLMDPQLYETGFLFEHLITPLAVVLDFLLVGRGQFRTRWWEPLTWTVFPLLYLVFFLVADVQSYRGFLNPDDPYFLAVVGGFLAGVLAVGFALFALARVVGRAFSDSRAVSGRFPPVTG